MQIKKVGFEIVKRRLEKNIYGKVIRRTFECKNSRKYYAKKKTDVEETRERGSVKIDCPWKVNINCTGGIIHITSICKEHNHQLLKTKNIASNRRLSSEMLEEI